MIEIHISSNVRPRLDLHPPPDGVKLSPIYTVVAEDAVSEGAFWFIMGVAASIPTGLISAWLYDVIKNPPDKKSVELSIDEERVDFHAGTIERRITKIVSK